ncbi:Outer membrane protein P5 precursor [Mariniflexile rhizosphaerae]|uniref:OmpA family protein n=1 Tax=unclassified Mariniflexile TaxID=2643887 RepID=UPI000CAABEB4|nr:OmpA family protein [Mariniflexile sp. TRM1-10]AXP80629.1 Outer membrane protein P5 precursor [Mariniflexile sp. TRM1-10]PLB20174.1 MAG: Outer membrane protein [Flavobacteriaceae bacterium FS1-H7996/R]
MNKQLVLLLLALQCMLVFSQNELTHEVYFDTDKYVILPTEESRLLLFISNLSDIEIESISIFGFCDDVGADSYNLRLSQQRANAIKTVFSNNEISEDLISNVDGKGKILLKIVEEKNVVKIRGLNRKVEIIVKPKPPKIVDLKKENKEKEEVKKKDAHELLKGELKVGDKIVFENILFKTGYSQIMPESKKILESIAHVLVERKDIYFTIQGHVCCTQNTRDAVDRKTKLRNLSEARAEFIYNYFIKKGVNKKRMRHIGLRRKFPLGGDPKFDRRVEIVITYVGK